MLLEACSFDYDEDMSLSKFREMNESHWNGHTVRNDSGNISPRISELEILSKVPNQRAEYRSLSQKNIFKAVSGSVGASAEGKTNSDGTTKIDAEVYVSAKDDDGGKVTVTAEVSVKQDNEGNQSSSGGIKISVEKEF
jgi:hypothetical protein